MDGQHEDDDLTRSRPLRRRVLAWLFGWRSREAPAGLPRRLGRYRVLKQIGEGGMGVVLLASDDALRRKVALKTLKRTDKSSRTRFLREARAAARVSHPNVCPIFEVGQEGRRPFLAMELLPGETLAARLRRGPLSVPEAMDLAQDLLAALGALHDAGIVHRDVKPSNLFLTPHGGKLLDFGLARELPGDVARALASATDLTRPGLIIGTPGYMAPEQILGQPVDLRADLFAAGVVLYEVLAGRQPFQGENVVQALAGTLYEEPPSLEAAPELAALDAPIRRALAKKPAGRHDSAREMATSLRDAAKVGAAGTPGPSREAFVGRQTELAWLEERLAAAAAGSGSVVFVTGERGVGKSSLVGQFLGRVRAVSAPITVVAGRCSESQGPAEAFQPFLDAVGRVLTSRAHDHASALLRTYAPTICVQMPAGLLPDPDGALHRQTAGATKERLIREAGDFMEAACRAFPIIFFIEDMQWADPASVDLLHHVGYRVARQRILIVGAFRQADVDASNPPLKRCALDLLARGAAQELSLATLTEENVGAYLEARFPAHRFPIALPGMLHARTEGLALFLRSLVDVLLERGDIVRDEGCWTLARPVEELVLEPTKGLQDFVRQQLEGLARPEREILEAASVAGREFLSPVIAHLVERDERHVEEDLRRLGRVRRLIVELEEEALPDGAQATRYRFAHGLYASVLREDLLASRRIELHRQVAARLRHHWGAEAPRLGTEIARHCEEGRDYEEAVTFRGHAGDNDARFFAYAEAEAHYDWAFRLTEKLAPGSRGQAVIRLAGRRGAVRLAQARFDDATADFESMLQAARTAGASTAERAALAGLCDAHFFARRVERMADYARELLDVATRAGGAGEADEARARTGQVLVCEGRLAEAVSLLDGVIAAARRRGPGVALQIGLSYRGCAHYWQARFEGAEGDSAEALALATELGNGFYALAARMFLGLARANLGRISEALDDFADAIVVARRNDDRYWLPRLVTNLGWVHRELGAIDRAREYDMEALRLARERPVPWAPESEALFNLFVDDVRVGEVEQASRRLAELEAKATESAWFGWMNELRLESVSAEHWAKRGDYPRALAHTTRLAALAQRLGARNYSSTAERLRAEAALALGGDLEDVARRLDAALNELRGTRAPMEVWKAARVLALLRRRLDDDDAARAAFEEAGRAIETIAGGVRDENLRDRFLNLPAVREVLQELTT
jgi:tetratricopeptide (TPR) repeat protein